ncbi:MAG: TerB family tellurite resistance protein, partial [Gammaproteobacteria bacterium]
MTAMPLRRLLTAFLAGTREAPADPGTATTDLRRATAALLVEMMRADFEKDPGERDRVLALLREHFALDAAAARALLELAEREVEEASSLFGFTQIVDRTCTPEEKIRIVEALWEVAWADGRLDKYEEYLVRKLADLLHVRHADLVQAKHR